MERISARTFFSVLWKGLCQAVRWFFGLFGYKRGGTLGKIVWGVFATSAAVIMLSIAYLLVDEICRHHNRQNYLYYSKESYDNECISDNIYFHEDGQDGAIIDVSKREKTLKNVLWIAMPADHDTLVCFSNGKKRGYFDRYTGKVVIRPKFDRAWIFSEGLAAVEEDGRIKFINSHGEVVIDNNLSVSDAMEGCVFHNGLCVIGSDENGYGLMDRTGKMVLPKEYSAITPSGDHTLWRIVKDGKEGVVRSDMQTLFPLDNYSICIDEGKDIDITMPDHTIHKYDREGKLLNDFCITGVRTLEYEKDEILYRPTTYIDDEGEVHETGNESYHPDATARLRAYVAGHSYEGLMTPEGRFVTPPIYYDITAIGPDLYLCSSETSTKVVVDGKGQVVK